MKKIKFGILLGICAGIIDIIPMIAKKITWDANLSAFFLWVIAGFFIAAADIKLKGALKGLLVSFLLLIPVAFLVWYSDTSSIIPMAISTVILGASLGFLIEKYGK